jgi:hypothetical protein
MHSTTTNPWLVERAEDPPDAMEYICIATDLLQQMFSALQSLATSNTDLARAMSTRESVIRHRLWTLHGTVDLLLRGQDESPIGALMRRATALISWLSAETDELALRAAGDESRARAHRIAFN